LPLGTHTGAGNIGDEAKDRVGADRCRPA